LKLCRCRDCRKFHKISGDFYCDEYIGGTAVVWATGERFCDPPPDAWHYCAGYDGPLLSGDVWVWPKATNAKHEDEHNAAGPSERSREDNRGGNGRAAGFFRSTPCATGKEA